VTRRKYPKEFLERLKAIKSKRPKTVIDHILKQGFITTEELEQKYGYRHPPRAARDVREQGIPLETFRVKNKEGRTIAAYRFADPSTVRSDKLGGRKVFSKEFKEGLIQETNGKCSVCREQYEDRYLQVDHRVPYEITGDINHAGRNLSEYMLLCGSCNRAKSWSCEHCANWLEKSAEVRRLDVVWTEREIEVYERLQRRVETLDESMPGYVKAVIRKHLEETE
jgi:hypothetical protein